jgi:hypothetical protein
MGLGSERGVWADGYLPLFTSQDMLDVYADVELGMQLDPPQQIGESSEIRLPTTKVMLQEGDTLPVFPPNERTGAETVLTTEPSLDDTVPF